MNVLVAIVLLLALCSPLVSWWAGWVLRRHEAERSDLPGTGGDLARHLVERFGLVGVIVEPAAAGGHYDPAALAVRLDPALLNGRSLAAAVVAAHEVGHALQHREGCRLFSLRQHLARAEAVLGTIGKLGVWGLLGASVMLGAPSLGVAAIALGIAGWLVSVLFHLATLPVEWDASFTRALPVLREYLSAEDMPVARDILRACALTYLGAALVSLSSLRRWLLPAR
ncbi:MAG: zinc metallopeptidase [Alphaproteobacteria bacterium]|nr:zinc metallopeptidase [Alphaproteobacteria bacterium]